MPPFKIVKNFELKRDLVTFLQNSVRDPRLQLEDMKVKLHAVLRLRERIIALLDQYGRDALVGTLRTHLEDVETEMRRRIRELPDGSTRVLQFMDSSLRENALQKISCAITVKGDRMVMDFRGSAPQFMNRSVNTNIASFKAALCTGLLQNIWPDLPHTMAVLSPIEIITDRNSILDAEGEMPQAMSLMPLFKGCVVWTIPMNKLSYSLPHRYSAVIASQYDQAGDVHLRRPDAARRRDRQLLRRHQRKRAGRAQPRGRRAFDLARVRLHVRHRRTRDRGRGHAYHPPRCATAREGPDRLGQVSRRDGLRADRDRARGSGLWGFMTGCESRSFRRRRGYSAAIRARATS